MVLLLTNSDVEQVLTMKVTLEALGILYKELGEKEAVFFPRQDLHVPLARPEEQLAAHYLKVMGEASPAHKTVVLRLSSDVCMWPLIGGLRRRVKLPVLNGKWLRLIFLFSSVSGELLAIIQDGFLSRMRQLLAGTSPHLGVRWGSTGSGLPRKWCQTFLDWTYAPRSIIINMGSFYRCRGAKENG